ncbi:hypothetical protein CSAL01_13643 [Colletotrichum salicis]|uniref:Uncharacterized protein n=1 Tax=Colletotrichum salicis TaxID=1209931 RepID=A0A135V4U3_9PEZI|nr:hypothetical protein CSAL01_13643 [Colletotrichum salicis]
MSAAVTVTVDLPYPSSAEHRSVTHPVCQTLVTLDALFGDMLRRQGPEQPERVCSSTLDDRAGTVVVPWEELQPPAASHGVVRWGIANATFGDGD